MLYLWTGAEVAAEGQRVLIVLAVAGILGSGTNVFAFYLLANGRTRTNAAISLVTALFTLGYLAIWAGFSILAATLQWHLDSLALLSPAMATDMPRSRNRSGIQLWRKKLTIRLTM